MLDRPAPFSLEYPHPILEQARNVAEARERQLDEQERRQHAAAETLPTPTKSGTAAYPTTPAHVAASALQATYPVWELTLDGEIVAANLPALWLWDGLSLSDRTLHPSRLLGQNVFTVFSRTSNFHRIAIPSSVDAARHTMHYIKSGVVKNLLTSHYDPMPYISFIQAMRTHPTLWEIYLATSPNQRREWDYMLTIRPLEPTDLVDWLEFEVVIFLVEQGEQSSGFLVLYRPVRGTVSVMKRVYERLADVYGKLYVLPVDDLGGEPFISNIERFINEPAVPAGRSDEPEQPLVSLSPVVTPPSREDIATTTAGQEESVNDIPGLRQALVQMFLQRSQ